MAEPISTQIAVQGFSGLLANLASSYLQRAGRRIKQDGDVLKTDLKDHLESTFNKCIKVKTILNHEVSAETLAIYVDQTFRHEGNDIDQYTLIEQIREGQSVVIIGEGGGGKSMFMRYLWLSFFEKSDGKIPFFLELRNLNSLSHKNIRDFIFHSIIKSGSAIRQDDFNEAMKSGEFILFLDGFDEINFDRRDSIQEMLLDLKAAHPSLTMVVTSRSDERFYGWEAFSQARVNPMNEEQSRKVIARANYNEEMKEKFLSKLPILYKDHKDFLSNPLLAYMMLVTFSFNPDIPKRMFQFYEQAFEALYHRHDLTKGYKRTFHCSLDKFDFIRLVSYFCLKTYIDETVEFTKHDLMHAVEKARKIEDYQIKPDQFIDDLVQSVCLLKIEGLTYTFIHRSFQEYFAALCIARVASRNIDKIFGHFAKRNEDRVLPMVAGMNPDLFREKYVIPNASKFSGCLAKDFTSYAVVAAMLEARFTIRLIERNTTLTPKRTSSRRSRDQKATERRDHFILLHYFGEFSEFFRAVLSVVLANEPLNLPSERDDETFVDYVSRIAPKEAFPLLIESDGKALIFTFENDENFSLNEDEKVNLNRQFQRSFMHYFVEQRGEIFQKFVKKEMSKDKKIDGAFEDLF